MTRCTRRRIDGVHLIDAARELGFECALVVDFLGELGLAEGRLVEQLEARAGGGLAAQAHARGGQSWRPGPGRSARG